MYYKVCTGKYKEYVLPSVNCSTAVYDAFLKAIPKKIISVYRQCPALYGFLNTPFNVFLLLKNVKNKYKL